MKNNVDKSNTGSWTHLRIPCALNDYNRLPSGGHIRMLENKRGIILTNKCDSFLSYIKSNHLMYKKLI